MLRLGGAIRAGRFGGTMVTAAHKATSPSRRSLVCASGGGGGVNVESASSKPSSRPTGATGWQFLVPPSPPSRILLGCVSYDPAISTIWDRMADHLRTKGGLPGFDFVLFTNYEAQVGALLEGYIDVAWNGPVAHVMAEDLAVEYDRPMLQSLGMRDCDRDFRTVCLARIDSLNTPSSVGPDALSGLTVATGSTDSPQGHLVPVDWLTVAEGVEPESIEPHEADLGKHGDTALGEVAALESLLKGEAQAALLSDMMYRRGLEGMLQNVNPSSLRDDVVLLDASPPPFDHCSFDALIGEGRTDDVCRDKAEAFARSVLAMDMNDPEQAETMKLEGINRCWMGPRADPLGSVRDSLYRRGLAAWPGSSFAGTRGSGAAATRAFSTSSSISRNQTVGVIGAGVAGLQTIRALRSNGFNVTAFEASDGVGGLWRDNYLSYGVQVPKQLYEFTDLPFDEVPVGEYPTGKQVKEYIERYSRHFDLDGSVVLGTRVVSAVPSADGESWTVTTEKDGSKDIREFDKLVVCTGMYSSTNPYLPTSGDDATSVEVLHTSDFRRAEQAQGKKVVVVGGGKSAIDVAIAASDAGAEPVTLLSRRPHWPTPRKIADLIPFQYVFLSRLGENLVLGLTGPLPSCSPAHSSLWYSVGKFIMPSVFKVVELLFAAQFRNVTGPTSPFLKCGVVEDFYGYSHVLDYSLRDKIKAGAIDWRIGEIKSYEADAVVLADGSRIEADVVAYGTGFKKDYSIFPDETRNALNVQTDGLYLYNHTIPTAVPNLAFVGSELATIMNITSYGLQAAWLAKLWSGEMQNVPDREAMEKEVEAVKAWKRSWMPNTSSRASLVLLHQTHFHDRLMKDMGLEHRRKFPNVFAECFAPYQSQDYHGVIPSLGGGEEAGPVVGGSS